MVTVLAEIKICCIAKFSTTQTEFNKILTVKVHIYHM